MWLTWSGRTYSRSNAVGSALSGQGVDVVRVAFWLGEGKAALGCAASITYLARARSPMGSSDTNEHSSLTWFIMKVSSIMFHCLPRPPTHTALVVREIPGACVAFASSAVPVGGNLLEVVGQDLAADEAPVPRSVVGL